MSATFIAASLHKEFESGAPPASAAAETVQLLFAQAGIKPSRANEVHWLPGTDAGPLQADCGFTPETPIYNWPFAPLMDSFTLQAASRAVWMGERDLVLLVQTWQQHVGAVLLASPVAVGRYNLMPKAQIMAHFSLCGEGQGLLSFAAGILQKQRQAALKRVEAARQAVQQQQEPQEPEEEEELPPGTEEIDWLASRGEMDHDTLAAAFVNARRLVALPPAPQGDLFLLDSLCRTLRSSRAKRGLLVSPGPQQNGLAVLVERV